MAARGPGSGSPVGFQNSATWSELRFLATRNVKDFADYAEHEGLELITG